MRGSLRIAAVIAVLVLGLSSAQAHNIGGIHAATGSGGGLQITAGATAASVGSGTADINGETVRISCAYVRDLDAGVHQLLASGVQMNTSVTWYISVIDAPGGDEVAYSTIPAGTGECDADVTPTTQVAAGSFSIVG